MLGYVMLGSNVTARCLWRVGAAAECNGTSCVYACLEWRMLCCCYACLLSMTMVVVMTMVVSMVMMMLFLMLFLFCCCCLRVVAALLLAVLSLLCCCVGVFAGVRLLYCAQFAFPEGQQVRVVADADLLPPCNNNSCCHHTQHQQHSCISAAKSSSSSSCGSMVWKPPVPPQCFHGKPIASNSNFNTYVDAHVHEFM